jgi:cyclase
LPYKRTDQKSIPMIWDYRFPAMSQSMSLSDAIASANEACAGEILLYDVDRDGSLQGLDVALAADLDARNLSIPILMAGGAGTPEHFSEVLLRPVIQGVVAGSIFSLTQETPSTIRAHCEQSGIRMRRP